MAIELDNKINILKAFAIMAVVSGHLNFSLIPIFPSYSYQVVLFFFISGMLFHPDYSFFEYFKRRVKTLLIPYFVYCFIYIAITLLFERLTGKFWGLPLSFKNEFLMPFLTGHQLELISPLWFVPQLFLSLIVYKLLNYIKIGEGWKLAFYFALCAFGIELCLLKENLYLFSAAKTMFSLFFIHLGFTFQKFGRGKWGDFYSKKIFMAVIFLQAFLWLTNEDYCALNGTALGYFIADGVFQGCLIPILTGLTGIWISLFLVEKTYGFFKDWDFFQKIGQNTYHIMANHLLVFNILTYSLLFLNGIPFDVKNAADIRWYYLPHKTMFLYFFIALFVTTYFGEWVKRVKGYLLDKYIVRF